MQTQPQTILVQDFIRSVQGSTWFKCAGTQQQKDFVSTLVSHFGTYEEVTEEEALEAVCGAISYNQRTTMASHPVPAGSALMPAQLTMSETLFALRLA